MQCWQRCVSPQTLGASGVTVKLLVRNGTFFQYAMLGPCVWQFAIAFLPLASLVPWNNLQRPSVSVLLTWMRVRGFAPLWNGIAPSPLPLKEVSRAK